MKLPKLLANALLIAVAASPAPASVPSLVNFQGILKDGSGNPVADGAYIATFNIYDLPVGGTLLWSEGQGINTTGGLFAVLLGSTTPIPDSVFRGTSVYLGISVNGDPEMTPRQRLVSVGYSFRVNTVDSAAGGTITSKVAIGPGNSNTGTDAFVAGSNNRARGAYSTVGGGGGTVSGDVDSNAALGDYAVVAGGRANTALGWTNTISGGWGNTANGLVSTVSGGEGNAAGGDKATVGGGQGNVASGPGATIDGGVGNSASGSTATIAGGALNDASGSSSAIGGGQINSAQGQYALVSGGGWNAASGSGASVGGGVFDTASGTHSVVGGGYHNVADADSSVVGGGVSNRASGRLATVGGGLKNIASGGASLVGGGQENTAGGGTAAIGGGVFNLAGGDYSTIAGGWANSTAGTYATIGGGKNNVAGDSYSTVGGGANNAASALHATVAGGLSNNATGSYASVSGGAGNRATGAYATVAGGWGNLASGNFSMVSGGSFDTASAPLAVALGGFRNRAGGYASLAAGTQAKADHAGAFVWADTQSTPFASTGSCQVLIRASGGVGIGTNSPKGIVHAVTASDNAPLTVASWDSRHFVVGAPDNSGGLGISYDQTNHRAYLEALSPNTFWRDLILQSGGGRVGIGVGVSAPAATLHVNGTAGNNTGVWSNLSDRRLKQDIEPMEHALETVSRLNPVTFRWKDPEKDAQFGRVRGLIAQDVEGVIPEWVKTDPDGFKRIEPIGVDALLLESIKELKTQNEELREEVQKLKTAVAKLNAAADAPATLGMK
jgi:hypothetical protein